MEIKIWLLKYEINGFSYCIDFFYSSSFVYAEEYIIDIPFGANNPEKTTHDPFHIKPAQR